MKFNPNRRYPYPVLKPVDSDYRESAFDVNIDVEKKIRSLKIDYTIQLKSPDIEKAIKNGDASIFIHIENSQTKYRDIKYLHSTNDSFEIDLSFLNGNVEFLPAIVANRNLYSFNSSDFHEDYKDENIMLEKGNFMAIDYETVISVDKDIEDEVDIPSIITLFKKEDQNEAVSFDFSSDRIYIYMNKKTWENYNTLRNSGKTFINIINSIMIIPAISQAIKYVKEPDDEETHYSDKRWFRSLRVILENNDYDLNSNKFKNEDNYTIAQVILNNMIEKSVDALNGLRERERV